MKTLLIIAHGSKREQSNEEVRQLVVSLRQAENNYDRITCAFLELATPSIPDSLKQAISQGASSITVMPYFLAAGRHVAIDIPERVAAIKELHPEVEISITPHLGLAPEMVELVLDQAAKAQA